MILLFIDYGIVIILLEQHVYFNKYKKLRSIYYFF